MKRPWPVPLLRYVVAKIGRSNQRVNHMAKALIKTEEHANPEDLEVRKLEGVHFALPGGYIKLRGWGVYNKKVGAYLSFETSKWEGNGPHGRISERIPYSLPKKSNVARIVAAGLLPGSVWVAI